MPPFAVKVVVSVAALPILAVLFVCIAGIGRGSLLYVLIADVVCGLLTVVGWIALWRSTVNWTRARIQGTVLATICCTAAGAALAWLFVQSFPRSGAEGAALAGVFGGGCWILWTTWLWRQTPAERLAAAMRASPDQTVLCPTCGYNLAGLYEARCPECGTRYTLVELLHGNRKPLDTDEPGARQITSGSSGSVAR
jgi:hypothetical protein